jgi:hypothetical protein
MRRTKLEFAVLAAVAVSGLLLVPDRGVAEEAPVFRRGDANGDETVDLSDVVAIFKYLFFFGSAPACQDAADVDDCGTINVGDCFGIFGFLFSGYREPELPGPFSLGPDARVTGCGGLLEDPLGCEKYPSDPAPKVADLSLGFEGYPAEISGAPGEVKTFEVYATLTTSNNSSPFGAAAWSIGLTSDGGAINEVTVAGLTVPGIQTASRDDCSVQSLDLELGGSSFTCAELAGHTEDPSRRGGVSAVFLRESQHMQTLPPGGTSRIARITVEAAIPEGEECAAVTLRYEDGFKGKGQPVKNVVTMIPGDCHGVPASQVPVLGSCTIRLCPVSPGGLQRPGDANGDGALDLSDAIWILGHLFLGSHAALPCEGGSASSPGPGDLALVDVNGDGGIDLSDAVNILSFLFLGSGPPALGKECVRIVGCPDNSAKCGP